MTDMDSIDAARARYARMLAAQAGAADPRLERAFATVPRERFLGRGSWLVEGPYGFIEVGTDDPTVLYRDVLVALSPERGINNGQPSLHALSMEAMRIPLGGFVVHVGAGTGYYTAILAELVGPAGRVLAYEIERDLADSARENLAAWPNVEVRAASACDGPLPLADAVYVNAGATHPLASWLDALKPGGRLMFPLTSDHGVGGMLLVTRTGGRRDGRDRADDADPREDRVECFGARFTSSAAFIACRGARSEKHSQAVAAAFSRGTQSAVKSLWRGALPDDTAWCVGTGWWLSTGRCPPRT